MKREEVMVEISTDLKKTLSWDYKSMGMLVATIWNGQITELKFTSSSTDTGNSLVVLGSPSSSNKLLRNIYKSLGELLDYIDKTKMSEEEK